LGGGRGSDGSLSVAAAASCFTVCVGAVDDAGHLGALLSHAAG